MTLKIRADRVALALRNIFDWKDLVRGQAAAHLMPLLALLEKGMGKDASGPTVFREKPEEFAFWDRYFRIEDGDDQKPYFNPITLRRAEAGFPHSNAATIRKKTFELIWKAAQKSITDDGEAWELSPTYADIFRQRVLTKGGLTTRVPVVDLAAIFFRSELFADTDDARALERRFRERFPQQDADYEKLFEFVPEEKEHIFDADSSEQDYDKAITSALVDDFKSAEALRELAGNDEPEDPDDTVLVQVQQLLKIGTSGIILTGPPGTGKSYRAKRIARHLVGDPALDIFNVQFHPSYGYEDFVEGYRPDPKTPSGYSIVDKTFVTACKRAHAIAGEKRLVVVIIDEISRGDPARIFGELLTYIERSYRHEKFVLPFSGDEFSVPENLILIGTMNPHDRSVSQLDAAFIRRFDQIEIPPSRDVVESLLDRSGGFTPEQISEIGGWFEALQRLVRIGVGHSFFADVRNLDELKLIWRYRMRPTAEAAVDINDGVRSHVTASFDALIKRLEGGSSGS